MNDNGGGNSNNNSNNNSKNDQGNNNNNNNDNSDNFCYSDYFFHYESDKDMCHPEDSANDKSYDKKDGRSMETEQAKDVYVIQY